MSSPRSIAVIGGGPAGLMAAETLAQAGHAVTVYDHMPSIGRKFLMAGRGGLNLTHDEPLANFLPRYGQSSAFMRPILEGFTPVDLRAWCEGLGQPVFTGSSGHVFPKSMKASPLLRAWLKRLELLKVQFALKREWIGWDSKGRLIFRHNDSATEHVSVDATVLALGGASWPKLGSNGAWASILAPQGVAVTDLAPANCGFIVAWSDVFKQRFAGTPLKPVAVMFGGRRHQGEAMITGQGIEGGAIYALSAALREAIAANGHAELRIDLRPGLLLDGLTRKLETPRGSQSLATYLRKAAGLSPVVIGLLREAGPLPASSDALAERIKNCPVRLTGTASLERAISTAGGISLSAIDAHLMLKARTGVFVAGEMLDWEAPTGGYLLQGCFSSGVAAARGVLHWLQKN